MARNPNEFDNPTAAVTVSDNELNASRVALATVNTQVTALAAQLGYDGSLTVGALEDEIRFYQRRTVEACLELGKRLLLLKELTPHGEFAQRVELLDISDRMARKFMSATLKFAKRNSSSVLQAAGTQTKLLELVVLDDGEIEALENGDSVGSITLDAIETMSVSELKKALREAKATITAKEQNMADKNAKIDQLAEQLTTRKSQIKTPPPDVEGEEIRKEASGFAFEAESTMRGKLHAAFQALAAHTEAHGIPHGDFMAGLLGQLQQALNQLRSEFDIKAAPDGDDTPEWLRPGAQEAAMQQFAVDMAASGWQYDAAGNMVRIDEDQLDLLDGVEA